MPHVPPTLPHHGARNSTTSAAHTGRNESACQPVRNTFATTALSPRPVGNGCYRTVTSSPNIVTRWRSRGSPHAHRFASLTSLLRQQGVSGLGSGPTSARRRPPLLLRRLPRLLRRRSSMLFNTCSP